MMSLCTGSEACMRRSILHQMFALLCAIQKRELPKLQFVCIFDNAFARLRVRHGIILRHNRCRRFTGYGGREAGATRIKMQRKAAATTMVGFTAHSSTCTRSLLISDNRTRHRAPRNQQQRREPRRVGESAVALTTRFPSALKESRNADGEAGRIPWGGEGRWWARLRRRTSNT